MTAAGWAIHTAVTATQSPVPFYSRQLCPVPLCPIVRMRLLRPRGVQGAGAPSLATGDPGGWTRSLCCGHQEAGLPHPGRMEPPTDDPLPPKPTARTGDRCVPPPLATGCESAADLSPQWSPVGVMDGPRALRLLRNHSAARQALNLTHGVLKGGMSVFITYLSHNKYLKCVLTSSGCTIGLCGRPQI